MSGVAPTGVGRWKHLSFFFRLAAVQLGMRMTLDELTFFGHRSIFCDEGCIVTPSRQYSLANWTIIGEGGGPFL